MKSYTTIATLALALCASAVACNKPDTDTTTTTSSNAPTNTQTNARDNNSAAVTPMDQGNNSADINTTAAIRKSVMADDALSTDAKNVKIVTNKGVITLRGPVKTLDEKNSVGAKALAAASGNRVDNQLDIKAK